jgi:hypothetical protein
VEVRVFSTAPRPVGSEILHNVDGARAGHLRDYLLNVVAITKSCALEALTCG